MGIFGKRTPPRNLLNPFKVAENFGLLVLEELSNQESTHKRGVEEIQIAWSPIMAAITRAAEREGIHRPILENFKNSAKSQNVRLAVEAEVSSRNESFYDPIFKHQSEYQSVTNQVLSQCYEGALRQAQRTGVMDANSTARILDILLTSYVSEKKSELDSADSFFINVVSQTASHSTEVLWEKMLDYGIENTQIVMKINSAVIATALILKYGDAT
jgi:hypothetical protein